MESEDKSIMKKISRKEEQKKRKNKEKPVEELAIIPGSYGTLNELIDDCAAKYKDLPAIGMALEDPLSYGEMHRRILALAAQLQAEGITPGDRVAFLAENSSHWGIAYFAAVRLGAAAVPILPDLPEADVRHILGEMQCRLIFITQRQIEKIYELKNTLNKIVTLDDYTEDNIIVDAHPYTALLKEATEMYASREGEISFPEVTGRDLASILYTSGTSGFSKAVMLTHYNLCANCFSASKLIEIEPGKTFLSVLPISHTYEFTVGFLLPLVKGCRVVYAGKTPTPAILQKICSKERPSAMLVVPLIMEKIFKKRVLPAIRKSRILTLACRTAIGRKLIYKKIGAKLLDFFGGNLEVMGIGGAAINPDVESFLRDAGFPYIVGYGLTESAPLLSGGPQKDATITLGSAGKPVPHVEIRIADPDPETGIGEIQARGPNVMKGYWNDPEATADTFTEDGWLRTGDIGILDAYGNLKILGRSKSVIVLSSGENVYPEAIEHKLNAYSFVVESLVLENNGLVEAWIYPDYEYIDAETTGQSRQQRHQYITTQLEQMRIAVNEQLPITSRLSRIVERREPFIKTATHKIKRYLYSDRRMES
ncbi:MAG: AMP-binding protein [Desulfobulbaceae bacterium]|nr:AMP-binding protein [Desulfobulbaceae bacterium]